MLVFALAASGSFDFGAEGPTPDVLTVVGTLFWNGAYDGVWDSTAAPTEYNQSGGATAVDDGVYTPGDVALVGMGYYQLRGLQACTGLLSGVPAFDSDFRSSAPDCPQAPFGEAIVVMYYQIFVGQGDGGWPDPVNLPINKLWSQFSSIFDNGSATRSVQIQYSGALASYVYCATENNNAEQNWVTLDNEQVAHQYAWGPYRRKSDNRYPASIELDGIKTWSHIAPAVTITVVADSVSVTNWTESPSLGARRNPPPDLLKLEPNTWLGLSVQLVTLTEWATTVMVTAGAMCDHVSIPSELDTGGITIVVLSAVWTPGVLMGDLFVVECDPDSAPRCCFPWRNGRTKPRRPSWICAEQVAEPLSNMLLNWLQSYLTWQVYWVRPTSVTLAHEDLVIHTHNGFAKRCLRAMGAPLGELQSKAGTPERRPWAWRPRS